MTLQETQDFVTTQAAAARIGGDYFLTARQLAAIVKMCHVAGEVHHQATTIARRGDAWNTVELAEAAR